MVWWACYVSNTCRLLIGDFDWSFLRFSLAGLIFSDVYEGMQSWILVVLHGELMLLSICPSLESFGSYEPSNLPRCYKLVSYSPLHLSFFFPPLFFFSSFSSSLELVLVRESYF